MRALTPRSPPWRWLPDIAANVLIVAIVALTLVAFMSPSQQRVDHSQPPQGPAALVEALWMRLNPGNAAIYDLDDRGLHLVSPATGARQPVRLFVLSQRHYDRVPTVLRQTGADWIETTVPEALGTAAGWRDGFLALGNSAFPRAEFEVRLAALLRQGAGSVTAEALRLEQVPAEQSLRLRGRVFLARLGNGIGFLTGLGVLLILQRRLRRGRQR